MNAIFVATILMVGAVAWFFADLASHQNEQLGVCIQLLDPEVNAVLVEPN